MPAIKLALIVVYLFMGVAYGVSSLQFIDNHWRPGIWIWASLVCLFLAYLSARIRTDGA